MSAARSRRGGPEELPHLGPELTHLGLELGGLGQLVRGQEGQDLGGRLDPALEQLAPESIDHRELGR